MQTWAFQQLPLACSVRTLLLLGFLLFFNICLCGDSRVFVQPTLEKQASLQISIDCCNLCICRTELCPSPTPLSFLYQHFILTHVYMPCFEPLPARRSPPISASSSQAAGQNDLKGQFNITPLIIQLLLEWLQEHLYLHSFSVLTLETPSEVFFKMFQKESPESALGISQ